MRHTSVSDLWGIGRQYARFLSKNGFETAFDLVNANESWIKRNMSVNGLRMVKELKGIPCYALSTNHQEKNICTSRSFGMDVVTYEELMEAIASYASTCALKLRKQKSLAASILSLLKPIHLKLSKSV